MPGSDFFVTASDAAFNPDDAALSQSPAAQFVRGMPGASGTRCVRVHADGHGTCPSKFQIISQLKRITDCFTSFQSPRPAVAHSGLPSRTRTMPRRTSHEPCSLSSPIPKPPVPRERNNAPESRAQAEFIVRKCASPGTARRTSAWFGRRPGGVGYVL